MNILIQGFISVVISAAVFFAGVNIPASKLDISSGKFGTVGVTTISTATTLAAFPAIYNADLSALDNGKIDSASTTVPAITTLSNLATVGTITSGVWSGTAILPAKGGTGSTTLSANQVLLGNGTGNISVVSGWGTSGQFLTSGGGTAVPTWTTGAVDTSLNYNWTGTSLFKNFNASSTVANPITLNGLAYSTQSVRAASSTMLAENGSGVLSFVEEGLILLEATTTTQAMQIASSTATLTGRQYLKVIFYAPGLSGAAIGAYVRFNGDGAGNYGSSLSCDGAAVTAIAAETQLSMLNQTSSNTAGRYITLEIINLTASEKAISMRNAQMTAGTGAVPQTCEGSGKWSNTSSEITSIQIMATTSATFLSGTKMMIYGK